MKNYAELFETANKADFDKINEMDEAIEAKSKKLNIGSEVIRSVLTVIAFFGLLLLGDWYWHFGWFYCLVIAAISAYGVYWLYPKLIDAKRRKILNDMWVEREELSKKLQEKTKEFAKTIYWDDLLASLNSCCPPVSNEFQDKLRNLIDTSEWCDEKDIEFDARGIKIQYQKDETSRLIIHDEKYTYIFKGWYYYKNFPFKFEFDRFDTTTNEVIKVAYQTLPK